MTTTKINARSAICALENALAGHRHDLGRLEIETAGSTVKCRPRNVPASRAVVLVSAADGFLSTDFDGEGEGALIDAERPWRWAERRVQGWLADASAFATF